MAKKNGVILELRSCELLANGTFQAQYLKNVYEDDKLVGCLGYHRKTITQDETQALSDLSDELHLLQAKQINDLANDKTNLQKELEVANKELEVANKDKKKLNDTVTILAQDKMILQTELENQKKKNK